MRELWLIRGAAASAFDAGQKTRDWQAKRQADANRVALRPLFLVVYSLHCNAPCFY